MIRNGEAIHVVWGGLHWWFFEDRFSVRQILTSSGLWMNYNAMLFRLFDVFIEERGRLELSSVEYNNGDLEIQIAHNRNPEFMITIDIVDSTSEFSINFSSSFSSSDTDLDKEYVGRAGMVDLLKTLSTRKDKS